MRPARTVRGAQGGIDGVTMGRSHALVSAHQRRHRHTLRAEIVRSRRRGVRPYAAFAAHARLDIRGLDADQSLAGDGMLALRETRELRLVDRPSSPQAAAKRPCHSPRIS